MTPQCERILSLLKRGPVTPMDALINADCLRLAARVNDLRMAGHVIETQMISKNGKRFASYRLVAR